MELKCSSPFLKRFVTGMFVLLTLDRRKLVTTVTSFMGQRQQESVNVAMSRTKTKRGLMCYLTSWLASGGQDRPFTKH